MSSPYLYFDDTSSVFTYSNTWLHDTHLDQSEGFLAHGVYNNTLSFTATAGSTVTIDFIASQIIVIGATIAPPNAPKDSGPITSYVIDNSQNSAFLYQADVANATNVDFFNSGPLTSGRHTLKITVLDIDDNVPFLLDAVAVGQPQGATPTTAVWVTTVFATGTSAPTSVLDRGNSTTSNLSSDSKSSAPVGAIVGGVVGGVALLVGAALAFYFLYTRRRSTQDYAYQGFTRDMVDTEKHHQAPAAPPVPSVAAAAVNDGRFSTQYTVNDGRFSTQYTEGGFSAPYNDGRFSTQYAQYDPSAIPARPMSAAYTDGAPPHSPSMVSPRASVMVTPHTSIYSVSALGAGAGGVAALAALPSHAHPGSVSGSSASGAGGARALSVVNDHTDVGGATLTAAQLKAAEAEDEKKKHGGLVDPPVQFHSDSGVRFDGDGNPILPSGSGSGSGAASAAREPDPIEVPPEYTEI
ncbi:hypothetical protein GSI_06522 [Ganoderma sinense ZZ0214-1]|uniref:Uncharacterized protein n=1 Tax=Ganoderma sinense ZZ0214-1 TaxID=1077348 RepID=A0A2G8SE14_9APHY|nr:hypothetical protein GSI_06522 [Ganoderma sinense ZZ0214-1]